MRGMLRGAISFYFALILSLFIPIVYAVGLAALCAVGTAVFSFVPKLRKYTVFSFFGMIAFSVFLLSLYLSVKPYEELTGQTVPLSGTVVSTDSGAFGKNSTLLLSPDDMRGNIKLYYGGSGTFQKGDRILITARFTGKSGDTVSDIGKGIYGYAYSNTDGILSGTSTLESRFYKLSRKLSQNIKSILPDNCGDLLCGITAGDKSALSDRDTELLRKAGFSHLINISGLHMSLVAAFVFGIFSIVFSGKKKTAAAFTVVFISLYVLLTGLAVSALRAGLMLGIYYLGYITDRAHDSLNSLGFASVVILTVNPFATADPSFQLSLLSTLGIILTSEKLSALYSAGKLNSRSHKILSLLTPSFAAVIFSAPASAVFFGEINLISPVSNLFLSVIVSPLVISGMLFGAATFIGSSFISFVLGFISSVFCKAVFFTARLFGNFSFLSVSARDVFSKTVAVAVPVLIVFFLFCKNSLKKSVIAVSSAAAVCLSVLLCQTVYNGDTLCYIVKSDGLYAVAANGADGYITVGELNEDISYSLCDILKDKSVSAVAVSSDDDDTVNAAYRVCSTLRAPAIPKNTEARRKLVSRYSVSCVNKVPSYRKGGGLTEITLKDGKIQYINDGVNISVSYNYSEIIFALVKSSEMDYYIVNKDNLFSETSSAVFRVYKVFGKLHCKEVNKRWAL